jgi:hypothetical protein
MNRVWETGTSSRFLLRIVIGGLGLDDPGAVSTLTDMMMYSCRESDGSAIVYTAGMLSLFDSGGAPYSDDLEQVDSVVVYINPHVRGQAEQELAYRLHPS